jgi:hypothetical protein
VSANISEGFGRGSGRDRDRSLEIARGESEETIRHLKANFRAERIGPKDYWPLRNKYIVIVKMINSIFRAVWDFAPSGISCRLGFRAVLLSRCRGYVRCAEATLVACNASRLKLQPGCSVPGLINDRLSRNVAAPVSSAT